MYVERERERGRERGRGRNLLPWIRTFHRETSVSLMLLNRNLDLCGGGRERGEGGREREK